MVEQPVYTGKVVGSSPTPRTNDIILYMPYVNRQKLYEAQKRYRIRIREQLLNYLLGKKCVDCGENDPIVLDFDHKDASLKFKDVSKMLSGHYSWKSIIKEVEKCEIRCSNCHRRKTYNQFKFFGKSKIL